MTTNQTALVTGAAGFLGSHLCDRLLAESYTVVGVDNFVTGSRDNLRHLGGEDRFEFIEHDVSEPLEYADGLDVIFHFASPASPIDFPQIPIEILKVNGFGTFNCLQLARSKGARFLFASTSEIYGDPLVHPQTEEYLGNVNPIGIRGAYDESKRYGEAMTTAFRRTQNVDTKIVRIFNTYGPRMRLEDGRVVPNLVAQALRGEPLTVYGTGQQTRSFCYVSDLIDGIFRLSESKESGPINIGNPAELTILEFAQRIKELTGAASEIVYRPLLTEDDPKQRKPDITKATERLGWAPKVGLEDGLRETIRYFQSKINYGG
jgi:dTDP-glucose 4,6-dehydratase